MLLILMHVGKEKSEYLAKAGYPDLTKKIPNIAGLPSVYTESIIGIFRS